jgi:hypothetical protein
MTNKDLISKLNNLGKISPDQNWLSNNRELLLSQISNSGAEDLPLWRIFVINLSSLSKTAIQPAYALVAFVLVLVSGLLISQPSLSTTKPNNSLYIARIIAEKVKLNTTFNAAERDKLAVQYAADHAQDISAVLADPKFNTPANQAQVAQLNTSFSQEVSTVKSAISRLTPQASAPAIQPAKTADIKIASQTASSDLIIADSSKDQKGLQLLEKSNSAPVLDLTKSADLGKIGLSSSTTLIASSSDLAASSTLVATSTLTSSSRADQILDEAQKLFDAKNYNQASDKLKEVDKIIQ